MICQGWKGILLPYLLFKTLMVVIRFNDYECIN